MAIPSDISGLQLWLDTSQPNSLYQDTGKTTPATTTGQSVLCWADKSGNGFDAIPNAAGTPTLLTGSHGGKLALDFPSSHDRQLTLGNPAAINFGDTAKFTIFAVYTPANADGGMMITKCATPGSPERIQLGPAISGSGKFGRYEPSPTVQPCTLDDYSTSAANIVAYQAEDYYTSSIASNPAIGNPAAGSIIERTYGNSNICHLQYGNLPNTASTSSPWTIGGWDGFSAYGYSGVLQALIIYNRILSQSEVAQINEYLASTFGVTVKQVPTTAQVVYDGNSLTYGIGADSINGPYPTQIYQAQTTQLQFWNMGVPACMTSDMIAAAATRIDPLISAGYGLNILLGWEGSNESSDATTSYNNLVSYYQARVTEGWDKVGVCTILSRDKAGFDTYRATVNGWLRSFVSANPSSYFLVDYAADPDIGVNGAWSNMSWFTNDGVHLNNAGLGKAAAVAKAAIDAVLASGGEGTTATADATGAAPSASATAGQYIQASATPSGAGAAASAAATQAVVAAVSATGAGPTASADATQGFSSTAAAVGAGGSASAVAGQVIIATATPAGAGGTASAVAAETIIATAAATGSGGVGAASAIQGFSCAAAAIGAGGQSAAVAGQIIVATTAATGAGGAASATATERIVATGAATGVGGTASASAFHGFTSTAASTGAGATAAAEATQRISATAAATTGAPTASATATQRIVATADAVAGAGLVTAFATQYPSSGQVRIAGQWRQAIGTYVRVGGVWRTVTSTHVRQSGAWHICY